MAVATYLADTSATARLSIEPVSVKLADLLERGLVATCATLNLEALFSAKNPDEYGQLSRWRNSIFEYVETDEVDLSRAQEVQALLAEASMHRSVGLADLIVAAVAERHRLTILHYDSDFEHVAAITGQPIEWIVPKGSVS